MPALSENLIPAHTSPAVVPRCVRDRLSTTDSHMGVGMDVGNVKSLKRVNGVDGDNGAAFSTTASQLPLQSQSQSQSQSQPLPLSLPLSLVPPPPLISPAFTPPTTPGGTVYASGAREASSLSGWYWNGSGYVKTGQGDGHEGNDGRAARSNAPADPSLDKYHRDSLHPPHHPLQSYPRPSVSSPAVNLGLVDRLPAITCAVRARIPTTIGTEMFLHLYHNDVDDKEHLAIVFGTKIRSRSLDAVRPGETEMDRMVRGAYTGRLFPGRASSSVVGGGGGRGGRMDGRRSVSKGIVEGMGKSRNNTGGKMGVGHSRNTGKVDDGNDVKNGGEEDGEEQKTEQKEADDDPPPLVRIHSECYTGETVWSARCDCGEQLDEAARLMALSSDINGRAVSTNNNPSSGSHDRDANTMTTTSTTTTTTTTTTSVKDYANEHFTTSKTTTNTANTGNPHDTTGPGGVIIYLRQEGRGIGLGEKLKAYNLQDLGSDTYDANLLLRHPADARSYGLATAMLVDLGLGGERGIRLLTNNPDKVRAVEGPNREVVVRERVGMIPLAWKKGGDGDGGKGGVRGVEVERYLTTKVS